MFDSLPEEIWVYVLSYIKDASDIVSLMITSTNMRNLIKDSVVTLESSPTEYIPVSFVMSLPRLLQSDVPVKISHERLIRVLATHSKIRNLAINFPKTSKSDQHLIYRQISNFLSLYCRGNISHNGKIVSNHRQLNTVRFSFLSSIPGEEVIIDRGHLYSEGLLRGFDDLVSPLVRFSNITSLTVESIETDPISLRLLTALHSLTFCITPNTWKISKQLIRLLQLVPQITEYHFTKRMPRSAKGKETLMTILYNLQNLPDVLSHLGSNFPQVQIFDLTIDMLSIAPLLQVFPSVKDVHLINMTPEDAYSSYRTIRQANVERNFRFVIHYDQDHMIIE